MVVRPITADDLPGAVALERALVAAQVGQVRTLADLPDDDQVFVERLTRRLDDGGLWWVAEEGGRIVGGVSVQRPGPSLLAQGGSLGIGVHPDVQGRGVGRQLMVAAMQAARAAGVERLELGVRADNPRAIRLYESLGFVTEGVRARFVRLPDGRYVDDHLMVCWLEPRG